MPHSAGGNPGIVGRNRSSGPLPLGDQSTVAARNLMVVRNDYESAKDRVEFIPPALTPVAFLRPEVKLSNGDKANGEQMILDMRLICSPERSAPHQVRDDVRVENECVNTRSRRPLFALTACRRL